MAKVNCEACGMEWDARPHEMCPRCMLASYREDLDQEREKRMRLESMIEELKVTLADMNAIVLEGPVERIEPDKCSDCGAEYTDGAPDEDYCGPCRSAKALTAALRELREAANEAYKHGRISAVAYVTAGNVLADFGRD